jgi:hypothetical protein
LIATILKNLEGESCASRIACGKYRINCEYRVKQLAALIAKEQQSKCQGCLADAVAKVAAIEAREQPLIDALRKCEYFLIREDRNEDTVQEETYAIIKQALANRGGK